MAEKQSGLVCSFCSKGMNEVKTIIAGPNVYICDECIVLVAGIAEENGHVHVLSLLALTMWNAPASTIMEQLAPGATVREFLFAISSKESKRQLLLAQKKAHKEWCVDLTDAVQRATKELEFAEQSAAVILEDLRKLDEPPTPLATHTPS